jgi:hypothetical protein
MVSVATVPLQASSEARKMMAVLRFAPAKQPAQGRRTFAAGSKGAEQVRSSFACGSACSVVCKACSLSKGHGAFRQRMCQKQAPCLSGILRFTFKKALGCGENSEAVKNGWHRDVDLAHHRFIDDVTLGLAIKVFKALPPVDGFEPSR